MWPVFVTWISLNNWPSWFPGSKLLSFIKLDCDRVIVSDWTPPCGMSILFKIFCAKFDWLFTESISWSSSFCSNSLFWVLSVWSCRPIWLGKYEYLKSLLVKHDFPFCSHWQGWCDLHLHLIASEGVLFENPSSIILLWSCASNGHNLLQYECWLWLLEQFHSVGIASHLVRFSI